MESTLTPPWPLWRRIGFRFAFAYLLLMFNPISFLEIIPGTSGIMEVLNAPLLFLTEKFNQYFLHIAHPLVMPNGSGDTSFGWAVMYTTLLLALLITIVWSLTGRKTMQYHRLNYWLCIVLRYTLAMVCFMYGIQKVFALQMPFPNMSQLATPLGDFLPMRLSWMFLGYSTPYQVFSGAAEVLAALLLLWRRTVTLGALVAFGVMVNVAMLNLSYDIPVKIYSIHLCVVSGYLLWQERRRLIHFFLLNKPAAASVLFTHTFPKKWMRIGRVVAKTLFVVVAMGMATVGAIEYYMVVQEESVKKLPPIKPDMYEIEYWVQNGDTTRASFTNDGPWKDVVFDYNGQGSINAVDSMFRVRYGRSYFSYQPDSTGKTLAFRKMAFDSLPIFTLSMQWPDSNSMLLHGVIRKDSVMMRLRRMHRHFQLTEKQFHWLSEANR
ncbi:hypothetical protein [Phnomibacter sp. MR]|uniref:hypothetical protein n=1 Tax=Phnomibacter sp. MR TaxID=3042318 RepID=UPI003A7FA3B4